MPSIELAAEPAKPSSRGHRARVEAEAEPASAPEPYGDSAARPASQSASRSTSRSSGQACASRWWESSTGWACWRCVRPGITAPRCALGLLGERVDEVEHQLGDRPRVVAQVASGAGWRSGRCGRDRRAAGRRARRRPPRAAAARGRRARPRRTGRDAARPRRSAGPARRGPRAAPASSSASAARRARSALAWACEPAMS